MNKKITAVQVFNWDRKQSKRLIIFGILESVNSSCSTFCFISCLHPKKTSVYQLLSFALETWMFESQLKKGKKIIDPVGDDAKSTSVPKYSFVYARHLSGTFKELRGNEWISGRVSTSHRFNCLVIKTDSVQSSSNYLQKLFTKNLLTARQLVECYLKNLILIQLSKWPRDEIPKHSREI